MIVCVCKCVSDHKIYASVAAGVDTFDALQFELGVATCCGKCEATVRGLLADHPHCTGQCPLESPPAHAIPIRFTERKAA